MRGGNLVQRHQHLLQLPAATSPADRQFSSVGSQRHQQQKPNASTAAAAQPQRRGVPPAARRAIRGNTTTAQRRLQLANTPVARAADRKGRTTRSLSRLALFSAWRITPAAFLMVADLRDSPDSGDLAVHPPASSATSSTSSGAGSGAVERLVPPPLRMRRRRSTGPPRTNGRSGARRGACPRPRRR